MTGKRGIASVFRLFALVSLAACAPGSTPEPPTAAAITAQPTDQSVVAGATATFNVVASNATGYQWQRSTDGGTTFVVVSGATSASHTTAATTLADSGTQYRVAVSGASNSVTSSAVTLTVTPAIVAPGISVQPNGQTVTAGQNAGFTVTATGTSLGYQWQRSTDGGASYANVTGATNATLSLTAVPLADNAHQFRVVVSNSVGSVTSNAALLTVNAAPAAPAFSTQPVNQNVVAPGSATFSVIATGNPAPTLQWQVSTDAGGSFADIAGATGTSYTTPATAAGDHDNRYRVVATNAAGNATSNAAVLSVTVPAAPVFTVHPQSTSVIEGQNAQLTVTVTGTPTPSLQWQLSTDSGGTWSNINGATGTMLDIIAPVLADSGRQFRAVASNGVGPAVNSNAATLTVTAAAGTTVLVSVTPSGTAANNTSLNPSLSADGRLVAFTSIGTDLVPGFSNSPTESGHAYVRNLSAGVTAVINQTPGGGPSSRGVHGLKLAAGGRYAVFTSLAGDLVPNDTNGAQDVFLRDLQAGATTRLNVLPNGAQAGAGNGVGDLGLDISADGRWVVFLNSFNLVGDGSFQAHQSLYLRDTQNDVTRMLATDSASQVTRGSAISSNGRYVVYLRTLRTNDEHRLMRYDIALDTTEVLFTWVDAATSLFSQGLNVSADGRFVALSLRSATLLAGAAATHAQVVVLDTVPGTLTLASTGPGGAGDGRSLGPVLSGDGRYVLFNTFSPSLTGDPLATGRNYVMVRDLVAGTTQVASRRADGSNVWQSHSGSTQHKLSSDGAALAFVADVAEMGLSFTLGGSQVFAAPRP